jgi:hypothetical protein
LGPLESPDLRVFGPLRATPLEAMILLVSAFNHFIKEFAQREQVAKGAKGASIYNIHKNKRQSYTTGTFRVRL